jgi:hypothetical protein
MPNQVRDSYRALTAEEIEIMREDLIEAGGWLPEGRARLSVLCDMAIRSLGGPIGEVERLKEALRLVKSWVVGELRPNWENDTTTYLSRGKIADICDIALAHPNHPRDMHLTIESRPPATTRPIEKEKP